MFFFWGQPFRHLFLLFSSNTITPPENSGPEISGGLGGGEGGPIADLAEHLVGHEGVGLPFLAKGADIAVAGDEGDIIAQRP